MIHVVETQKIFFYYFSISGTTDWIPGICIKTSYSDHIIYKVSAQNQQQSTVENCYFSHEYF